MNAIEVMNLTKVYRLYSSPMDRMREIFSINGKKYHHEFYALNNLSFNITKGETTGIIGQNGSGKSTLLKIICGVTRPTSGSVQVNGRISALLELGAGFHPEFTGRENVYMNGALMGFSREEMELRFPDIEAFAEIGEFIDQPVKTYSSGMFVRLAFAAAINVEPDILVIDEALAVGDMVFQHRCMSKIQEFKKKKVILFVTHDMGAIVNFCNKALWLRAGKVEEIGDPKSVSEHYQAYTYDLSNRYVMNRGKMIATSETSPYDHTNANSNLYAPKKIGDYSKRFGNGAAKIIGMEIVDLEGNRLSTLWAGTPVNVAIHVECVQEIVKPMVGFSVRDRLGNVVFATNTDFEGYTLPTLEPRRNVFVNFVFSWPFIAPGSYSFSPAVADGTQQEHVMCDWVQNVLVLEANSEKKIMGFIKPANIMVVYNTSDEKIVSQVDSINSDTSGGF